MKLPLYSLIQLRIFILFLWPMTAWATEEVLTHSALQPGIRVTLGESLVAIPPIAWIMVLILCLVSGMASLLNTLKDTNPVKWKTFVMAHMLGSCLAGFLVFFAAEFHDMADLLETIAIAIGAYAGARLTERLSDVMLKKVSQAGGVEPPKE